jgi:hypothetical protein
MRSRRAATVAFLRNHVASFHAHPFLCVIRRKVRIPRRDAEAVIDNYHAAISFPVPYPHHHAIRRGANIVADTEAQCFSLSKTDFDAMGDAHPKLGLLITREVARVLSQRLTKTNDDLVTLFTAFVSEIEEG